ncbi:unnamed protein product [Protopolystoma xenopodis]|uniref:Uncharacterized protein n=1 Tax=Protopolystoma xenopodis TaxID=117903 RepID=A0A448WEZ7_9PLAT|nr:unnamed protein product [Protopolystoma xenopodis]
MHTLGQPRMQLGRTTNPPRPPGSHLPDPARLWCRLCARPGRQINHRLRSDRSGAGKTSVHSQTVNDFIYERCGHVSLLPGNIGLKSVVVPRETWRPGPTALGQSIRVTSSVGCDFAHPGSRRTGIPGQTPAYWIPPVVCVCTHTWHTPTRLDSDEQKPRPLDLAGWQTDSSASFSLRDTRQTAGRLRVCAAGGNRHPGRESHSLVYNPTTELASPF